MVTIENMKFLFKGIVIDERTQEYIEKRLSTLDKFIENISNVEVEVDLDKKGKFRVEVMVHTPRNMFRADNTTDSVEASTDMVVDEMIEPYLENLPKNLNLPMFVADPNSIETKSLKEEYLKNRENIISLYKDKNFLKVTLGFFILLTSQLPIKIKDIRK